MSGNYRILMVAPTSFFLDYGCHVRILEEARVLQALGHQVTLITYYLGRDIAGLEDHTHAPHAVASRLRGGIVPPQDRFRCLPGLDRPQDDHAEPL